MELERFRNYLLGQGYAVSTIKAKLGYLRRVTLDLDRVADKYKIAEWLYSQNLSPTARNNAASAINSYLEFKGIDYKLKLTPMKGEPDLRLPDDEDVERLFRVSWKSWSTTARNRLLLKALFLAALRSNEARMMKYTDVRLRKRAGFPEPYLRVVGKGNKERQVPIPPSLFEAIHHYRDHYGPLGSDYIFDTGDGVPLANPTIRRIVKEAGEKGGVPGLHPHTARHWRAVDLTQKGVDVDLVRRFLGHASIATTQLYLRGRDRDRLREALAVKDGLFTLAKAPALKESVQDHPHTPISDTYLSVHY